jgi:hypothetical protein
MPTIGRWLDRLDALADIDADDEDFGDLPRAKGAESGGLSEVSANARTPSRTI